MEGLELAAENGDEYLLSPPRVVIEASPPGSSYTEDAARSR